MGGIKLPIAPRAVGLFINANAIMGKRDFISVSLCTYQCVCCAARARACMCVCGGRSNTIANSPNLFICKLDFG